MAEGRKGSLTGSGVARGIAIGRAHLLARSELDVRQFNIERRDVVHEIGRLTTGFNAVRAELDQLKSHISAEAPSEVRAFLDLHRMILDDALLAEAPRDLIRTRLINAESRGEKSSPERMAVPMSKSRRPRIASTTCRVLGRCGLTR